MEWKFVSQEDKTPAGVPPLPRMTTRVCVDALSAWRCRRSELEVDDFDSFGGRWFEGGFFGGAFGFGS